MDGSRAYTFEVPFMSPRATRLLDRLRANQWLRNVGRKTALKGLVGEGVTARFARSRDEARAALRGLPWDHKLTDAFNATIAAFIRLYGNEWYQKHFNRHFPGYARLVEPVRRPAARAMAEAWDLSEDRCVLLLSNMPGWLAAADLERKWRLEFHLSEAAVYLAGHVPCGWTGRDCHSGQFLVY
jgi:hypothetical protein